VVGESEVVRFLRGYIEPVSTDTLLLTSFFTILPLSFRAFVFLKSARFFFLVADTCDSRAVFFIFSSPFLVVRVFLAVFWPIPRLFLAPPFSSSQTPFSSCSRTFPLSSLSFIILPSFFLSFVPFIPFILLFSLPPPFPPPSPPPPLFLLSPLPPPFPPPPLFPLSPLSPLSRHLTNPQPTPQAKLF